MKKIKGINFFCFVEISLFFFMTSCSLRYDDNSSVESTIPEFIFYNTNLSRYENNKKTVELNAGVVEQYSNSSDTYIKDVEFKMFNDENEVASNGKCSYLFINNDSNAYQLFDNISFSNNEKNINVFAQSLFWNSISEQLVSGIDEIVEIQKDDISIKGKGLSLSAISDKFEFSGPIEGIIESE
jgi:LPS export ABC transporter protein LptC